MTAGETTRSHHRWTYPLAFLGAHLAFIPLLVLLLPRRVEAVAGSSSPVMLAWLLLAGGAAASIAHIVAGHLSDRWIRKHGSRRGLIAIGLVLLVASYGLLAHARDFDALLLAMIIFQLALNCAFSPLGAALADHVPHATKGRIAGLMNAGLPTSSLGVFVIAFLFPEDGPAGFIAVAALVAVTMLPLLLSWDFPPPEEAIEAPPSGRLAQLPVRHDFWRAWIARFIVQTGAAFVINFTYLYIAFRIAAEPGWASGSPSELVGWLALAATGIAIAGAILSGHQSDRHGKRRLPLAAASLIAGAGLLALGSGGSWPLFLVAYALFQLALASFLTIDTALVAELLAHDSARGTKLGLMNLTNTLPAIVAPALAILSFNDGQLVGALGTIFIACAAASLVAAYAVMRIRSVD